MKKHLVITILLIFGATILLAQEVTLVDSNGAAVAYIDFDDDATIFLWNGTPVAFLQSDNDDICIFGFNGKFLGWYEDGVIYDKKGNAVGARKGALNMIYQIEPIKSIQQITPLKPLTPNSPIKPIWSGLWSSTPFIEFLYFGYN